MKKAVELINWSSLPSGSSSLSCCEINSLSSTVRSLIKVSKPPGEKRKEVNTKSLLFYVVFAEWFWVNDGQADCYKQSRLLLSFSFYTVEKITLSTSAGPRRFELSLNLLPNFTYAALMEYYVERHCRCSGYLIVFFFYSTSLIVVQQRHLSLTLMAQRSQQPKTMPVSRSVLLEKHLSDHRSASSRVPLSYKERCVKLMTIRKNIGLSREPSYVAFIAGFQCHAIQNRSK